MSQPDGEGTRFVLAAPGREPPAAADRRAGRAQRAQRHGRARAARLGGHQPGARRGAARRVPRRRPALRAQGGGGRASASSTTTPTTRPSSPRRSPPRAARRLPGACWRASSRTCRGARSMFADDFATALLAADAACVCDVYVARGAADPEVTGELIVASAAAPAARLPDRLDAGLRRCGRVDRRDRAGGRSRAHARGRARRLGARARARAAGMTAPPASVEADAGLARLTTIGTGGPARFLARPASARRAGRGARLGRGGTPRDRRDRARLEPARRGRGLRRRRPAPRGRARRDRDRGHGRARRRRCVARRGRAPCHGGRARRHRVRLRHPGHGRRRGAHERGRLRQRDPRRAGARRGRLGDGSAAAAGRRSSSSPTGTPTCAGGEVVAHATLRLAPRRARCRARARARDAAAPQREPAAQGAHVRVGLQEPGRGARRRRADRGLRPQGPRHRRGAHLDRPRQLHRERRRRPLGRRRGARRAGPELRARALRRRSRARGRAARARRAGSDPPMWVGGGAAEAPNRGACSSLQQFSCAAAPPPSCSRPWPARSPPAPSSSATSGSRARASSCCAASPCAAAARAIASPCAMPWRAPRRATRCSRSRSSHIAGAIESVPTIHFASVDRDFPHTLRIRIVPERPVAIAKGKGRWLQYRSVVAASGRVLRVLAPGRDAAVAPVDLGRRAPGDGWRVPLCARTSACSTRSRPGRPISPARCRNVQFYADRGIVMQLSGGLDIILGPPLAARRQAAFRRLGAASLPHEGRPRIAALRRCLRAQPARRDAEGRLCGHRRAREACKEGQDRGQIRSGWRVMQATMVRRRCCIVRFGPFDRVAVAGPSFSRERVNRCR